jgi:spore maturation protein CgeB
MLVEGVHCGFYDDTASCIQKCGYYLESHEERERIRKAGEAFVRAHHTYDQRVPNLLENREFVNPLTQ